MGAIIHYTRPDRKPCQGCYASPQAATGPPVSSSPQEWWGVNDQIKGVAERLAGMGYRALVPNLYRR
jgi:carboxymethylenebutenolidase